MALVAHWVSCLWFMLYRLTHGTLDWSYDSLTNAKIMTYYLEAYLQSFLLMIGNDISPKVDGVGNGAHPFKSSLSFVLSCHSVVLTRR